MLKKFIIILTILLVNPSLKSNTELLFSGSTYEGKYNIVVERTQTNTSLRFLLNENKDFLFFIEGKDRNIAFAFGDIFINFGRGLILGNPKYYYFTKHIYEFKLNTNSYNPFNYYVRDRNYDKIEDILRGFCIEVNNMLTLFSLTDEKLSFSNIVAGAILKFQNTHILITKIDTIFLSSNFRNVNLFNTGIVIDAEGSIKIQHQPEYAIGGLIEWSYKKLELAIEGRVATSNFYTPFSESLFSKSNTKNGLITSSKIKEEKYLLSFANKLLSYNNEIESELYLFLGYKILKNTFIDLELINDYYQERTIFSIYPFLDMGFINLYIKPILSLSTNTNFSLELGSKIYISSTALKIKLMLPLTHEESYFITSTDTRDIFGENLDLISSTKNDFNIIFSINSYNDWFDFEGGINCQSKENNINLSIFLIFKTKLT
ncbi:MAG: hypothetical protein ACP5KI_06645 [Brevinematia bacterium]